MAISDRYPHNMHYCRSYCPSCCQTVDLFQSLFHRNLRSLPNLSMETLKPTSLVMVSFYLLNKDKALRQVHLRQNLLQQQSCHSHIPSQEAIHMLHRHLLMRPDTDFPAQRDNPQKELPSFQAFSHIILQNPDKHFESFQYIHHHEAVKQLLGSPSIISRPYLPVQNPSHCLLSDATIIPLKNSTSQSALAKTLLADAMPVPYLPLSFVMFRPESTDRFHEEKSQARLHSLTLPPPD